MTKHLEESIIGWALEMRAVSIPISYGILVVKTLQQDAWFWDKLPILQYEAVRCLCAVNCLTIWAHTHLSQQSPEDVANNAQEWLKIIRPVLQDCCVDHDYVINMDELSVCLSVCLAVHELKKDTGTTGNKDGANEAD